MLRPVLLAALLATVASFAPPVSHVARARFNKTGTHLVTVGKRDRAIMVWRIVNAAPPPEKESKKGATKTEDKK